MDGITMNMPSQRKAFSSTKSRFLLYLLAAVLLAYNFENIKFYIFYKQECVLAAVDIGGGKKLGMCGRRVINDQPDAPDIIAYVYDTSDQLLLPVERRSQEWLNIAGKIGLRAAFIVQDPITKKKKVIDKDKFGEIVPLGGHFYRVKL